MKIILLIVLFILTIIHNSNSTPNKLFTICPSTDSPTDQKYQANINAVLSSLNTRATTNPPTAFYTTSSGNGTTSAVYGLYFCRADQNATTCADCVTTATTMDLPNIDCPDTKVAVIWYDECIVRYSNESLLGKMAVNPFNPLVDAVNGRLYEGNQTLLTNTVENTMHSLVDQASKNNSGLKFATKSVNFTQSETLYVLQECTPDLSTKDCAQCLNTAISRLQIVKGIQVLQPSCHVRYELFPFYSRAVNISSMSLTPLSNNSTISNPGKKSSKVIIAIIVPIVGILLVIALGICFNRKKAKNYETAIPLISVNEDFTSLESLQYDLATLQSATNNFAYENKLGEGGFGGVYKGKLSDGQEIAVKRLSKSSLQGTDEFKNEVLLVAKLQHRRLVRLLGFCVAGDEKLLVYEYVPNKSLDHFLFDIEKRGQLTWKMRYNIIKGIARGMLYLHQDSQLRIIHRDLKASNVFLDKDMNPKISDFGMAKIFGIDQTHGKTTRVVGTYGYMSPEYAMHGQFSIKSDVYSFGVLVLEIISGMKNNSFYKAGYAEDLLSYAWNHWRDGTPLEFVDETIRESCSMNEVKKCMHLGLLCVQELVDDRPTMVTVALMLDGQSVSIRMPQQPAYYIKCTGNHDGSDQSTVPWSMNEGSISNIEPR